MSFCLKTKSSSMVNLAVVLELKPSASVRRELTGPDWCCTAGWALSWKSKGHWFDSGQGAYLG